MSTIQNQIVVLAVKFAQDILATARQYSLEEIYGVAGAPISPNEPVPYRPTAKALTTKTPRKTTKRTRRTAEDIQTTAKAIVDYVGKNPNIGADSIRKGLKIAKNEWLQPIALALTMGLKKTGSKRTTTYYVGAKTATSKKTTSKKAIKTASASAKATKRDVKKITKRTPKVNVVATKQADLFETPDLPAVLAKPITNGAAIDTNGAAIDGQAPAQA